MFKNQTPKNFLQSLTIIRETVLFRIALYKLSQSTESIFRIRTHNFAVNINKIAQLLRILQTNITTDRFDFLVRKGNSLF